MTKTLKINHERMQHAPAIVIDGAPVLSSRLITQLRKWLSHVLRQRVPFSTICPPSSWAALAGSPPTRRAHACRQDRQGVVLGTRVSVRLGTGGCRTLKKKK